MFRHGDAVCLCLNAAFCMTCRLLMLVEDARGDHMEEEYSRACPMPALYVAMSVSFCLPHPVAVSTFIIRSALFIYIFFFLIVSDY